jgi:hypothetical protein
MRYYNGNLITNSDNNPDVAEASGIFNLEAQLIHKKETRWPATQETFVDPTSGYVEFSRRFIESNIYMGNSNDYDGGYDVSDINVPSTFSGSARIYIGHKVSIVSGSTFYADVAIACVQILNSAGNSLLKSWNWSSSSSSPHQNWENLQSLTQITGTQTQGFPETLATSAARTFGVTLNNSHNENKFSYSSSTGSSNTGAADGISSDYYENGVDNGIGTILPSPGNAVVSQVSNTSYIYRETSGADRYSGVVCRSPAYTFSGSEIIRIAHCMPGLSTAPMNPNDTLYIGVA